MALTLYRDEEATGADAKVYRLLKIIYEDRLAKGKDSAEDLYLKPPEQDQDDPANEATRI